MEELRELESYISPNKRTIGPGEYESVYSREMDWLRNKSRKMIDIRAGKIRDEMESRDVRKKPRINVRSKNMFKGSTFEDRQRHFNKKKKKRQDRVVEDMFRECTYAPNINNKSYRILKQSQRKKEKILNEMRESLEKLETKHGKGIFRTHQARKRSKSRRKSSEDHFSDRRIIEVYDGEKSLKDADLQSRGVKELSLDPEFAQNHRISKTARSPSGGERAGLGGNGAIRTPAECVDWRGTTRRSSRKTKIRRFTAVLPMR